MKLKASRLGVDLAYDPVWQAMRDLTDGRDESSFDEVWFLQHQAVFTLGQAGKEEHLLMPGDIPIVKSDRGGQVTYHGPGQLVAYLLFDIRRLGIGVRALVTGIENTVISFLGRHGIEAESRRDAPGVYVDSRKIAALGLRVRKGCSYHGLSLNVDMDLEPFSRINPCGYQGLEVTDLRQQGVEMSIDEVAEALYGQICREFGYDSDPLADGR